jgi:hypothetical protein
MKNRPGVSDKTVVGYVDGVVKRLVPKGKSPPGGVAISTTVIDSPRPEVYAYVDGHVVLTTGVVFAMDNEAQLAGVVAHEVAHVVEGYYLDVYQQIKAAEQRRRRKAAAGALFGALLDVAVDYAVEVESIEFEDKLMKGEATYKDTMKHLAKIGAAQGAYYSIKDVIASVPSKNADGSRVDPRLQFEAVADAQGMEYLALAGYDTAEASKGWDKLHAVSNRLAKQQEAALGAMAEQMRAMQQLMELNMNRLRQSLGSSGLVQTIHTAPPTRAQFVARLTALKEVREAAASGGAHKKEKEYRAFLSGALLPRAARAMEEERYKHAARDYRVLYDKGVRTAPVACGLARSMLGDFAFGASAAEKKKAEALYKEAATLDATHAAAQRGLGELYEDWERYGEAAAAYRAYLNLAPKAGDRKRIERKIKVMERKAKR